MENYTPATSTTWPSGDTFGPTAEPSLEFPEGDIGEHYAGIAALLAAIAAAIGSIIYASKHVKSSSCLGNKCEQEVVVEMPASVRHESKV